MEPGKLRIPNNAILRIGDPSEGFTMTGCGVHQMGAAFVVSVADPDHGDPRDWIQLTDDASSNKKENVLAEWKADRIAVMGPVHVVFKHNLEPQPICGWAPTVQCVSVGRFPTGDYHSLYRRWLHVLTLFVQREVSWPCLRPIQLDAHDTTKGPLPGDTNSADQTDGLRTEAHVLADVLSGSQFSFFQAVILAVPTKETGEIFYTIIKQSVLQCPVVITSVHGMIRMADRLSRDHRQRAGIVHHTEPLALQSGRIGFQWHWEAVLENNNNNHDITYQSEDDLLPLYTTLFFGHRDLSHIQGIAEIIIIIKKQMQLLVD